MMHGSIGLICYNESDSEHEIVVIARYESKIFEDFSSLVEIVRLKNNIIIAQTCVVIFMKESGGRCHLHFAMRSKRDSAIGTLVVKSDVRATSNRIASHLLCTDRV